MLNKISIYTDGSYDYKRNISAYAVVVVNKRIIVDIIKRKTDKDYNLRNTYCELAAIMEAVKYAKSKNSHAILYYDYKGINKLLKKYKKIENIKNIKNSFIRKYVKFMLENEKYYSFCRISRNSNIYHQTAHHSAREMIDIENMA